MVTVGARTSHGKTALVLQIVMDILDCKKRVLYMSFEMEPEEILERMFCHKYRINNMDLLKGRFEYCLSDWNLFQQYIKNVQFVFSSDFGKTWQEIDRFISEIEQKPDLIVIDYIQAVAGASSQGKPFIDEYIRHFKQMCSENCFCGVLVSQLNRSNPENKDKSPKLHELKGSGFLEECSDVVILLDWVCKHSDVEDESLYVVNVAKNRNGRTGFIKLNFEPKYYLFQEYMDNPENRAVADELNRQEHLV